MASSSPAEPSPTGRLTEYSSPPSTCLKQVRSARGFKERRKALRIRHIHGMEVRKKRPRRVKKEAQGAQVSPLSSRICCSLSAASLCFEILPGPETAVFGC